MTNNMMTRQQAQAFGSYARDGTEGYAPANDDATPFMRNRAASDMERWAASRAGEASFSAMAYEATMAAARMRRSARRTRT